MSLEKSFCASPWFHMRINNSGGYEYCRWRDQAVRTDITHTIRTQTPTEYFQSAMSSIRQDMLSGKSLSSCSECYAQEKHHKVSGRQRQLLKVGIQVDKFEKTLASSTILQDFEYSDKEQGNTLRSISDWQIDLGNYCNSACVFCVPESSSRLASEFKKIGIIQQLPAANWCEDPVLFNRFMIDLVNSPDIKYLHFLGGETMITPAFKRILSALVDAEVASKITVGFTTNLTVWDDSINNLLLKFQQVNLGVSVETLTPTNDYVRWPSKQDSVRMILDRWTKLSFEQRWLMQVRITPTCLTIHELYTVYEYAWQHGLSVESCNFLTEPAFMRISVLPHEQRQQVRDILESWINDHPVVLTKQIVNTRDPTKSQQQIIQDAQSYCHLLEHVDDESFRLPDLIAFLKKLESSRANNILDYLPQYETIFRSAGL